MAVYVGNNMQRQSEQRRLLPKKERGEAKTGSGGERRGEEGVGRRMNGICGG